MPKWLVAKTLKALDKTDKLHESGKISKAEHDKQSKAAVESALAIERNITKKHKTKYPKITGKK